MCPPQTDRAFLLVLTREQLVSHKWHRHLRPAICCAFLRVAYPIYYIYYTYSRGGDFVLQRTRAVGHTRRHGKTTVRLGICALGGEPEGYLTAWSCCALILLFVCAFCGVTPSLTMPALTHYTQTSVKYADLKRNASLKSKHETQRVVGVKT